MEEVRKHCSDEPSLQKLVWEMDDAQLEVPAKSIDSLEPSF